MQLPFRLSLATHVLWGELLANLLDLPYTGPVLPAQTLCPRCGGQRLTVYDDVTDGGHWFHCWDCQITGDLIELAAVVWDCKPDRALCLLHQRGFPLTEAVVQSESLASYLHHHVDYRRRSKDLWDQANGYLTTTRSSTVGSLRHICNVRLLSNDRWRTGPGRLVGAAAVAKIEAAFVPGCLQPSNDSGPPHCVGDRIFKDRPWEDVLLIPFYDLPGRISGYMFQGRGGNLRDQVFHCLQRRQGPKKHPYEAGLAWLPQLCQDSPDREFVAINDPYLALRIQVRHFLTSLRPLPLTVWHDSAAGRTTRQAWQILQGRRVVIWTWQLDYRVVYQAIQADAEIAVAGPEEPTAKSLNNYVRRLYPRDLMRRVLGRGRPWRDVLTQWAQNVSQGAIEDLLLNLESYGVDVPNLCRSCPVLRCGQWYQPDRLPDKVVMIDGQRFIERSDGWYHLGRDSKFVMILDAIIRVERVEPMDSRQRAIYHGVIAYRGNSIPYKVTVGPRYRLARAVKDFLLSQGKGSLHLSIHYGKYLEDLAFLFDPLQTSTSVPRP
jgi:hypothetical protein